MASSFRYFLASGLATALLVTGWEALAAAKAEVRPQPVWNDQLYHRIKVFLAGARGAYVISNPSVFANFRSAVGLEYKAADRVEHGWILWSARFHSAVERGAALIDDDDAIKAVAILHYDCFGVWRRLPRRPPRSQCTDEPRLSVFVRRGPNASRFVGDMSAWADRQAHHHVPYKVTWVASKR